MVFLSSWLILGLPGVHAAQTENEPEP